MQEQPEDLSKYRQARASRKYKHGWEVPRDYAHALQLDIHNGNNKWKEAIDLEIEQIKEYQVFKDFGKAVYEKNKITNAPEGHQKIRVHFVFDVKHCGKFKARLVADGHLTKEPMETVYSGVVSIRNLRLAMFLAELNNLELWGADVGNAYLQALTREKLYIVGGPEFEELQGHVLVMYKALYGTRSGGACWHDKFFDILHDMGFKPSKADPDIWMKSSKDGSHYEYIALYVDDLAICMKDPKSFCDTLKEKYKLKLKGVGPINYHLGCGYTRDEDGTLVADPRKYVEKIFESYEKTFGEKPNDIIPSTTPGADPPRDARDSGSARSHSTHLETSSSDRPKMVTYTEPQTAPSYMSVKCTRRTLRMPRFTRAAHAQPSLSNFPRRDSDFWRADLLTQDDPGGTKFSHFPPK